MTAIEAETERNRLNRSARCAEKHPRRARTRQLRGLIPTVPAARPTAEAAQGGTMLVQRLDSGDIHLSHNALGECRINLPAKLREAEAMNRRSTQVFELCFGTGKSRIGGSWGRPSVQT